MITGRGPFEGDTAADLISVILQKDPVPLTHYAPDVPSELERIVTKALTKDREERYQTAKDLLIDLRTLKRKLEINAEMDRTVSPELRSSVATVPGSIVPTASASSVGERAPSSAEFIVSTMKQHRVGTAMAALVLVAAVVGIVLFVRAGTTTELAIESIAVLPFQNRSTETDTEYLSDGLAESLIYRLSQLPNLRVSPTSSVIRYKGRQTDVKAIASELGVSAVLTGRILKRGDNLMISVELVDVRNNKLLWGEQYDRKMADLLATQREIATTITQKLELRLTGTDARGITKRYTDSNEAYQLYLKGRYSFGKRTKEEMLRAIEFFRQAIKLDPKFAL